MHKLGRGESTQYLRPMKIFRSFLGLFFLSPRSRLLKKTLSFGSLSFKNFLALKLLFFKAKPNRFRQSPSGAERGITLMEMLMVVGIIGTMTVIAGPGMRSWWVSFQFHNSVREIVFTMQLARMKAISKGVEYRVVFDLNEETFQMERGNRANESDAWIPEEELRDIHAKANIAFVNHYTSGRRSKQFNPNGTSSSGSIRLNNAKNGKFTVTLTPTTGNITLIEGWE